MAAVPATRGGAAKRVIAELVLVLLLASACQPDPEPAGDVPQPQEVAQLAPSATDPHALAVEPAPAPRAQPARRPPAALPATPRGLDGDGRLLVADGDGPQWGAGTPRRFLVEVESGLGVEAQAFAEEVEAVLSDPRGWTSGDRLSLQRVDREPDLRVTLASPALTDELCAPLQTGGLYSCWNDGRAVINARRWRDGADAYDGDLANYRRYLVNHEVGHGLGYDHEQCPAAGRPAPVMMQQTKTVASCRPNPWPYR